jgi:hypothetical protein
MSTRSFSTSGEGCDDDAVAITADPPGAGSARNEDALHGTGRGAVAPRAAARSSAFEQKGKPMNDDPITDVTLRNAPGELAILAQDPSEWRARLEQTLGGGALELQDLDHVKMPTGGALTFTVPTPTGEESRRTLTGVLIHVQQRRAYWPSEFSGSGTVPDCSSLDAIVGVGNPGGACAACPLSQFPEEGGAPPCRLTAELVTFLEGDVLPTIVTASPPPCASLHGICLRWQSADFGTRTW